MHLPRSADGQRSISHPISMTPVLHCLRLYLFPPPQIPRGSGRHEVGQLAQPHAHSVKHGHSPCSVRTPPLHAVRDGRQESAAWSPPRPTPHEVHRWLPAPSLLPVLAGDPTHHRTRRRLVQIIRSHSFGSLVHPTTNKHRPSATYRKDRDIRGAQYGCR